MATYEAMKGMLTSRGQDSGDGEVIGDGVALGITKYPARVKCALLGWAALTDALARAGADLGKAEETIPAEPAGPSSADHGVRR